MNSFDLFWNGDPSLTSSLRGLYIAISGNTGAGKSTLVKALVTNLNKCYSKVIGVNERSLHHPLLPLMFAYPKQYAFPVQLHFVISRYSVLYRYLSLGYIVVIERSHLDDLLFVEDHLARMHITQEQFDLYTHLTAVLHKSLPDPDIYTYIDVLPKTSMDRLANDEQANTRPKEFPSIEVKASYVNAWYSRYLDLYNAILTKKERNERFSSTDIFRWSAGTDINQIVLSLVSSISNKAHEFKELYDVQFY